MSTLWLPDGRDSTSQSLLRMLAVAYRERLPLVPLLRTLALEHRFASRRRISQLADRIQTGASLVQALEQTNLLSDEQMLTLRFSTETGTLEKGFDELLQEAAQKNYENKHRVRQALFYVFILGATTYFMLGLLMVFIAPTFKEMFEEFGLQLPSPIRALISTCDLLFAYFPPTLLMCILLLVLAWVVKPFRFFRRKVASRVVPLAAKLRTSHLLRLLSLGVESGRPVPGALSTLARYHFDQNVRNRLLYARNEVEQGKETWQSLQDAHLISESEAAAFRNASSNSIRAWLMRSIAASKQEDADQKSAVFSMLIHPFFVIVFGVLIAWIAISFFSVLTALISSLA